MITGGAKTQEKKPPPPPMKKEEKEVVVPPPPAPVPTRPKELNELWVDRYTPKTKADLVGCEKEFLKAYDWLRFWKPRYAKKALLLIGSPGIGKSTMIKVLASALNYDIVEINASDQRTKGELEKCIGMFNSVPLFTDKKQMIVLEEADGLYDEEESYNALELIKKTVQGAKKPVIFTANQYNRSIKELKSISLYMELKAPTAHEINAKLIDILREEGIDPDPITKKVYEIASGAHGDIRNAIMGLQFTATDTRAKSKIGTRQINSRDSTSCFLRFSQLISNHPQMNVAHREALFESEPFVLTHMMHDYAYLQFPEKGATLADYEKLANVTDALSLGDTVNEFEHGREYVNFYQGANVAYQFGGKCSSVKTRYPPTISKWKEVRLEQDRTRAKLREEKIQWDELFYFKMIRAEKK